LGIHVPDITIFSDQTIQPNGACYRADENEFMIVLKERDEGQMMLTLAHEMVHVKQYLLDDLSDQFDEKIPYMERWWEQEAFSKEVDLMKLLIAAVENGEF
jgi:Zn-dependent peptidase ImmA (M78 family)